MEVGEVQRNVNLIDLVKTQELSNECVLAKIDVDTAEKESSNICQQLDSYYWID